MNKPRLRERMRDAIRVRHYCGQECRTFNKFCEIISQTMNAPHHISAKPLSDSAVSMKTPTIEVGAYTLLRSSAKLDPPIRSCRIG